MCLVFCLQQWFINALVDLFEQESEYVIDVLEDCRHELGRTAGNFLEEAEELRATSRMLGYVVIYIYFLTIPSPFFFLSSFLFHASSHITEIMDLIDQFRTCIKSCSDF